MIQRYNSISLATGIPGLVLQIAGNVMIRGQGESAGMPVALIGTVLLMVGLAYYAKAKGRNPAWCLMAFLSLIGLIVLACLKDRSGESS